VTRWFADASVLLASADLDDEQHEPARAFLAGPGAIATLDLAFYEVVNVAIRRWQDPDAARELRGLVSALGEDGGLVRADATLAESASTLAHEHGLSAYDAAYVAGAARARTQLVSCDLRDLVSRGLAVTPLQAVAP